MATSATRQRRRVERREELLDAADRLVRNGTVEMSMDEVASEAGITKPVLYRHFGDKDGLYEALAQRYVDELARELEPVADVEDGRGRLARAPADGARARRVPPPGRGPLRVRGR